MSSDQNGVLKFAPHSLYVDVISSNGLSQNSCEEPPLCVKLYEAIQTYNRPLCKFATKLRIMCSLCVLPRWQRLGRGHCLWFLLLVLVLGDKVLATTLVLSCL